MGAGAATSYGKEVDMWSMGVMLYIVLSAVPPFDDDGGDMYSRICAGEWEFDVEEFDRVSVESKDLVRCLLRVAIHHRLSVEQAIKHPWFTIDIPSTPADVAMDTSGEQDNSLPPVKRLKTGERDAAAFTT